MKNKYTIYNGHDDPEGRKHSPHRLVSVIGPCYNERDNIEPFIHSLETVLKNEKYDYEILLINDGSTDGTAEALEELRREHPRLRVLHLVRNFGQQGAMLAGIAEARGELIVTMDVDLQHPASAIPEMVRKWESGADVVYALPAHQYNKKNNFVAFSKPEIQLPFFKSFSSGIYQSMITYLQEPGQRYVSTDFRLFDREVADVIRQLPEQNPYIRNVFAWLSPKKEGLFQHRTENVQSIFRSTTIQYRLGLRQYGDTKYTVWQLVRLGIRGLTNGSIRPLRIGIMTGAAVFMISLILTGFLIIHHWVMGTPWTGWEMVLTGGMFLGSIQLMMLCLIGEYTGKIFLQSLGRPSYIIRDPIERNVNERAKEMKYKA